MFPLDWISENLETVRLVSYVLSGAATGASALAGVIGLRRKLRKRRKENREEKRRTTFEQAVWFRDVYRDLVIKNSHGPCEKMMREDFLGLTVQEACAIADRPLPEWAHSGMERAKMCRFAT